MLQSWQQFGLAYGGDVVKDSEAIQLDGVVDGYARAGLNVRFGPPRAIVTFPTMRQPALGPDGRQPSVSGYVNIAAILTGDPNAASNVMMVSVDGEAPHVAGSGEGAPYSDTRIFNTPHIAPGVHTVKVWRTQKDGKTPVLESEYTAQYFVEGAAPVVASAPAK